MVPQFFFGAMSPYSWFAAERIGGLLPRARWHGVFAGALFKANGRVSWGLTAERQHGIADCEARAAAYGLGPIRWPEPWPTSDLLIARALAHADRSRHGDPNGLQSLALSAMRLAFLEGTDLGEPDAVLEAGRRCGLDGDELRAALSEPSVKDALRRTTDEALSMGAFGVPTIVIGNELFWGDDRLEAASAYASA